MTFYDIFSKGKVSEERRFGIVVDNREKNSLVVSELVALGFKVKFEQLEVGDYLVNGVAVERKTLSDLKQSIINKRIFSQIEEIKQYDKHILIVERDSDFYSGLHENALRGFFLFACLEKGIPILFTLDARDSARYLMVLAKREESSEKSIRASKIALTREEQVLFILEGFPYIGPVRAKKLIEKFGSLGRIFSASELELQEVLGKNAKEFRDLIG